MISSHPSICINNQTKSIDRYVLTMKGGNVPQNGKTSFPYIFPVCFYKLREDNYSVITNRITTTCPMLACNKQTSISQHAAIMCVK